MKERMRFYEVLRKKKARRCIMAPFSPFALVEVPSLHEALFASTRRRRRTGFPGGRSSPPLYYALDALDPYLEDSLTHLEDRWAVWAGAHLRPSQQS